MINIPQGYIPPQRSSPLAGLGEAVKTLADEVIQGREKQALLQDYDLLPQILNNVRQLGSLQPGAEDVPGQAGYEDTKALLEESLGQMKTQQGKLAALKLMIEHGPVPMFSAAGEPMGNVPAKAKFLPKPATVSTTTVYDPKSDKMIQVPGRFAQVKTESETPILDEDGNVIGTTQGRPFQLRSTKDKYDILEDPEGNLHRVGQGDPIPEGWVKPSGGGKKGLTGRTKETVDFLNLMDMDPKKAASWDFAKDKLSRGKGDDRSRWAVQQAINAAKGDFKFRRLSPEEKAAYINNQAQQFLQSADEVGKGTGPAGTATVPGGGAQGAPGVMKSLPDPAAAAGRVIRHTVTGKRFKSDGQQWQPME